MSMLFNVWKVDGTHQPLAYTSKEIYAPKQIEAPERVWAYSWAFEKNERSQYPSPIEIRRMQSKKIARKGEEEERKEKERFPSPNKVKPEPQKTPPSPVLACQIMTSPVCTLHESASLKEGWDYFQQTRFRHIPIISEANDGKKIIRGIISDRSLMFQGLWHLKHPGKLNPSKHFIASFMVKEVITAFQQTPIFEIAQLLLSKKIGCMPICDTDGSLVGIITRSDLLRLAARSSYPSFRANE